MKRVIYLAVLAMVAVACGASKNAATTEETTAAKQTNLKGQEIVTETFVSSGVDMTKTLNAEGTKIVERPYKWFAGIGTADNKMVALELAQREAAAAVSRTINNAVLDNAKRGNLANNGKVQQALASYWEQVSTSVQKACEPYGEAEISYNKSTGMYDVTAKVGIRGDKYVKLLEADTTEATKSLTPEERQAFIDENKSILEAAKGF